MQGMINLNFAGTQVATLNSTVNKLITGAGCYLFKFISYMMQMNRDEVGSSVATNLQSV
jgi:hypothetical protein